MTARLHPQARRSDNHPLSKGALMSDPLDTNPFRNYPEAVDPTTPVRAVIPHGRDTLPAYLDPFSLDEREAYFGAPRAGRAEHASLAKGDAR